MFPLTNVLFDSDPTAQEAPSTSFESFMAALPALRALSNKQRRALARTSHFRSFVPGEVIVRSGQQVEEVFFIVTGQVCHTVENRRGQRLVLGESGPGTIVGTSAFTETPTATLTAEALTPVRGVACEAKAVRAALETSAEALRELVQVVAERRRWTTLMLVQAVQELM